MLLRLPHDVQQVLTDLLGVRRRLPDFSYVVPAMNVHRPDWYGVAAGTVVRVVGAVGVGGVRDGEVADLAETGDFGLEFFMIRGQGREGHVMLADNSG